MISVNVRYETIKWCINFKYLNDQKQEEVLMLRIPKWAYFFAAVLLLTGAIRLTAGGIKSVQGKEESIEVPIIMYHHILEKSSLLGDYVISPEQLESDLKYLSDHGYRSCLLYTSRCV